MRIYRFDQEVGHSISVFNSDFIMTRVAEIDDPTHVGCMHIGEDGVVGHHQAVVDQLFMVVQGSGWVSGEDGRRVGIREGEAAFWQEGEWHESGSDTGMVAIVIQSRALHPEAFLPEREPIGRNRLN